MSKFWKKAGWTGLTMLPMVASLAAQVIVTIAVMAVVAMTVGIQGALSGVTDPDQIVMKATEATMDSITMVLLLYHVLALVGFGAWYYLGCGRPKPQKPRKVFSGKALPVTILIGLFMCISATAFLSAAQYAVPEMIEQYEEMMEMAGLGTDLLAILASVLIAPIGEELLCRGLTFHYAKKIVEDMQNRRAAFWIANALQALMFAIMHGNLVQGSYAFVMGLGLGWLRWRYDSLYPSMLAHFVVNFSSTVFMGFLFYAIPETLPVYVLVTVVGIAVVLLLMKWDEKKAME